MRETILLNALEEIKRINALSVAGNSWVYHKDEIKKVITKALTDWASAPKEIDGNEDNRWLGYAMEILFHITKNNQDDKFIAWYLKNIHKLENSFASSAPESGGEETYWKNRCIAAEELIDINSKEKQPDNFTRWEGLVVASPTKEDFVPSVQSSDVTPVASHTSTSSNSIEQLIKKYKTYYGNVQWHIRTNKPPEVEVKKLNRQLDDYNEIIIDLQRLLPNSEQEDKRSVATEDAHSDAAGNQTSLSKEENMKNDICANCGGRYGLHNYMNKRCPKDINVTGDHTEYRTTVFSSHSKEEGKDEYKFAEWVSHSDWTYVPSKKLWYNEEDEENITPKTTEQLVQQFAK